MTRTSGTNCDHIMSLSQTQRFAHMLSVLHDCVSFIVTLRLLKSFCFVAHVYHIHAVMLWCWHARILISCSVSGARWSFACFMMLASCARLFLVLPGPSARCDGMQDLLCKSSSCYATHVKDSF